MKINRKGYELIKKFEGCKLEAYKCYAGRLTIGYGHTKNVSEGDRITHQEAMILLSQDIEEFENSVDSLVAVPLTENMFSALVSFAFNLGINALKGSTLLAKVNNKDYGNAANEFPKWIHVNKQPLLGLLKRRIAERKLFLE